MDKKKDFMETVKKEVNETIARLFDKVEDISEASTIKFRISKIKRRVKNYQAEIGRLIYKNSDKLAQLLEDYPEMKRNLDKIIRLEDEIDIQYEKLQAIKEREEKLKRKAAHDDDKTTNFTL